MVEKLSWNFFQKTSKSTIFIHAQTNILIGVFVIYSKSYKTVGKVIKKLIFLASQPKKLTQDLTISGDETKSVLSTFFVSDQFFVLFSHDIKV